MKSEEEIFGDGERANKCLVTESVASKKLPLPPSAFTLCRGAGLTSDCWCSWPPMESCPVALFAFVEAKLDGRRGGLEGTSAESTRRRSTRWKIQLHYHQSRSLIHWPFKFLLSLIKRKHLINSGFGRVKSTFLMVDIKLTVTAPPMHPCDGHTLAFDLRSNHQNTLRQGQRFHLNMLVLAIAAQPTDEISAAVKCKCDCYRNTSFVLKTEATFQGRTKEILTHAIK